MHPLAPNLQSLTDDELQKKTSELQNRLMYAYKMGHTSLVGQLHLLLDDYQTEMQSRQQKMMEELQKNNKSFSDKIDIAK